MEKGAICIQNNILTFLENPSIPPKMTILYLEKKSIGIKSEMFNLLTCFIIYALPDEEQLQFHTSLKICQGISKNKKVKITS